MDITGDWGSLASLVTSERIFFWIRVEDELGRWIVDYDGRHGAGYYPFRGYYPNGRPRQEGECFVEDNTGPGDPMPDEHNVLWGKYYTPDGKLGSSVKDGTGTQIYWYPDGTKKWELELNNYQRVFYSMWYSNGQLTTSASHRDGEVHGLVTSYHRNGRVRAQGEYCDGQKVGGWTRYDDDGSIDSVEEFSPENRTETLSVPE